LHRLNVDEFDEALEDALSDPLSNLHELAEPRQAMLKALSKAAGGIYCAPTYGWSADLRGRDQERGGARMLLPRQQGDWFRSPISGS
jgi:hypothetical protein